MAQQLGALDILVGSVLAPDVLFWPLRVPIYMVFTDAHMHNS